MIWTKKKIIPSCSPFVAPHSDSTVPSDSEVPLSKIIEHPIALIHIHYLEIPVVFRRPSDTLIESLTQYFRMDHRDASKLVAFHNLKQTISSVRRT